MRRFATAFTVATAGTAAMAATAQAATLTIAPVKACYLAGEKVTATGTGFTPSGVVDMAIDGTSLGTLTADAAGSVGATITLGRMKAAKSHALTATDTANPALTATVSYMGTTNLVTVKPANARAGKRLKIRGYGFLAGPKVYMHVRGRGYRSDQKVGTAAPPCGTFAARKRIVPAGAAPGVYKVQFDASKRYSKKTRPRFLGRMRVYRTFSATGARAAAFGGAGLLQSWTRVTG